MRGGCAGALWWLCSVNTCRYDYLLYIQKRGIFLSNSATSLIILWETYSAWTSDQRQLLLELQLGLLLKQLDAHATYTATVRCLKTSEEWLAAAIMFTYCPGVRSNHAHFFMFTHCSIMLNYHVKLQRNWFTKIRECCTQILVCLCSNICDLFVVNVIGSLDCGIEYLFFKIPIICSTWICTFAICFVNSTSSLIAVAFPLWKLVWLVFLFKVILLQCLVCHYFICWLQFVKKTSLLG